MQYIVNNVVVFSNDIYCINIFDCNNEWVFYFYVGVLINVKKMIEIGEEVGQEYYVGVVKILMVYNYVLLVDWWGDVLFMEVLQCENNGCLIFDQQELVYEGI